MGSFISTESNNGKRYTEHEIKQNLDNMFRNNIYNQAFSTATFDSTTAGGNRSNESDSIKDNIQRLFNGTNGNGNNTSDAHTLKHVEQPATPVAPVTPTPTPAPAPVAPIVTPQVAPIAPAPIVTPQVAPTVVQTNESGFTALSMKHGVPQRALQTGGDRRRYEKYTNNNFNDQLSDITEFEELRKRLVAEKQSGGFTSYDIQNWSSPVSVSEDGDGLKNLTHALRNGAQRGGDEDTSEQPKSVIAPGQETTEEETTEGGFMNDLTITSSDSSRMNIKGNRKLNNKSHKKSVAEFSPTSERSSDIEIMPFYSSESSSAHPYAKNRFN